MINMGLQKTFYGFNYVFQVDTNFTSATYKNHTLLLPHHFVIHVTNYMFLYCTSVNISYVVII